MTSPAQSAVQNLLPVQAYFNLDGSFNTFIGIDRALLKLIIAG